MHNYVTAILRMKAVAPRYAALAAAFLSSGIASSTVSAQCCQPAYTVRSQTVMVPQTVTRYKIVYETADTEREVVSYRPVLKTREVERTRTVSRPVVETSTVEERYTVLRPVTRREYVDRSYDQTTYVTETSEREEVYTTYRPVTETHYQTQNYTVQRPVVETQYSMQAYTTYKPVTTYQNQVVDQGQYVAQQYYQPGDTRYHLRWMQGGYATTPSGVGGYRRGGLGWVPYTSPGQSYAQLAYQPNPVQVAVPRTTMMPEVQQVQVPVQVTRMQSEVVQQQVPITQTRMEAVQNVRKVPVTVQRPVTTRIENKVPVDRVEWVEHEMIRPKEVTRTSYKIETITEKVPVQYYETEVVRTMVKVPVRVAKRVPYEATIMVPQTISTPVRQTYMDPYSASLGAGDSSWMTPAGSTTVRYGDPYPASESAERQRVKKQEVTEPTPDANADLPPSPAPDAEVSESDGLDLEFPTGDNRA